MYRSDPNDPKFGNRGLEQSKCPVCNNWSEIVCRSYHQMNSVEEKKEEIRKVVDIFDRKCWNSKPHVHIPTGPSMSWAERSSQLKTPDNITTWLVCISQRPNHQPTVKTWPTFLTSTWPPLIQMTVQFDSRPYVMAWPTVFIIRLNFGIKNRLSIFLSK